LSMRDNSYGLFSFANLKSWKSKLSFFPAIALNVLLIMASIRGVIWYLVCMISLYIYMNELKNDKKLDLVTRPGDPLDKSIILKELCSFSVSLPQ
jgi:hypothetical protein